MLIKWCALFFFFFCRHCVWWGQGNIILDFQWHFGKWQRSAEEVCFHIRSMQLRFGNKWFKWVRFFGFTSYPNGWCHSGQSGWICHSMRIRISPCFCDIFNVHNIIYRKQKNEQKQWRWQWQQNTYTHCVTHLESDDNNVIQFSYYSLFSILLWSLRNWIRRF